MSISFVTPAALWLLLILIPLWWLAFAVPRKLGPLRFGASLVLRTALLLALILGLSGLQIRRPVDRMATVFLVDRSESIAAAASQRAEEFVRAAVNDMPPDDRAGVIVFGENALVERAADTSGDVGDFGAAPVASRTNIESALKLGVSLFPADANKRLVLLSDGGQNVGKAEQAIERARAAGVEISVVDLGSAEGQAEALVSGIDAPGNARAGQAIGMTIRVESSVAQPAHLRVFEGDQVIYEQDAQLQAGTTSIPVTVQARQPGFQRYRAEVTLPQDTQPKNNVAEALIRVDGPPRVLLVEGTPGEAAPLHDALAATQAQVEVVAPNALPTDLAALAAYETVALVNVPVSALPAGAVDRLPQYVHDLGRGLLVIGGEASYGVGGYSNTPLEDALPVSTDVRDQIEHPKIAIVFVLDKSRSMQNCHCNGPNRETDGDRSYFKTGRNKIDIGKDGVLQSVATLSPQDTVGVITFDKAADIVMPLQQNITVDTVQQVIGPIPADGLGTNIGAGLEKARDTLLQTDAKIKHVVLLTDGWGRGVDPVAVAQTMKSSSITLSVIADGKGSAPYLQQLADAGGGRYLPADNPEDIPHLFVDETRHTAGNYLVETPFTPTYGVSSPVIKGLEQGLPQLYGYNATTPKQTASTVLYGLNNQPVLAQWQYGLGRVIAWTSDTKGKWAKDWLTWPGFPRFAAQAVGWLLPTDTGAGVSLETHVNGEQLTIGATLAAGRQQEGIDMHATLIGADGTRQEIPLARTGPDHFEATAPLPTQGGYIVQVSGTQNGQVVAQNLSGLVVPYSAEYGLNQHNPVLLANLAQGTGGKLLTNPSEAFAHTRHGATQPQELTFPLLLVALALLPLDILVRRGTGKRTSRR